MPRFEDSIGWRTKLKRALRIRHPLGREALAEFLGTFVLMVFGITSVAQYKLFDGLGTYLSVNWSWGIGVAMGVWVSGGISGGHINPAVSLAMAVLGRLSFAKCAVYMLAQYLGAFAASAVAYGVYLDALNHHDNGTRGLDTAGIWSTYPADFVTWSTGLADQVVGTAMLLLCIFAFNDKNNSATPGGTGPIAAGLLVTAIGMAIGSNCGYAINPARDLGPRLFTAIAGWGAEPFSFRGYNWFWVPIVGPHVGAVLGACIYLVCVGIHAEPHEDQHPEVCELKVAEKSNGSVATGSENTAYL